MSLTSESLRVLRISPSTADWRPDSVVVEEPLQVHVRVCGETHVLGSTMRTPGQDLELAVGLALAEGVIRVKSDVIEVRHCAGDGRYSDNDVLVTLDDSVAVDARAFGRVSHPSSACGMCGRDRIDELLALVPVSVSGPVVSVDAIAGLPDALRSKQPVFQRTGGLHAVGLADAQGELLIVREDVGRHNALDKVIGAAHISDMRGDVVVVSGRVGFEIVQKAAMAAIPVIAAISAPTSLAVDAARAAGITLAAFVRDGSMTVYSGEQRIAPREGEVPW